MCHNALLDATFYRFLEQIDEDEAARTRAASCSVCGCRLHSARYPRKPRGGPRDVDKQRHYRLSFCGAICRNRTTPVSVRFLGPRVYWAAVVVLATALRSGLNDRRAQQLSRLIGVPKRTLKRWRTWWLNDFVDGPFWEERARSVHATGRDCGTAGQSHRALFWFGSVATARCCLAFPRPAQQGALRRKGAPAEDVEFIANLSPCRLPLPNRKTKRRTIAAGEHTK
jgi:hypothetical protein